MKPAEQTGRRRIYLQTAAVAAGYAGSIALVDALYVHKHITDGGLAFGYSFVLVEGWIIGSLLLLSMVLKFIRYRREERWKRLHPSLAADVSAFAAGAPDAAQAAGRLQDFHRRYPGETERCVAEMLLCVHGMARAQVSQLAADLGLVRKWKRQYGAMSAAKRREAISRLTQLEGEAGADVLLGALQDAHDDVKLEAARGLIRSAGPDALSAVFQTALRESLLVRAVLIEALRPHTLLLCSIAVPQTLACPDARTVRIALDIVRAWGKSVPIGSLEKLLVHPDAGVRAAALAIVPQLLDPRLCHSAVIDALAEGTENVRAAAAEVAGKLRLVDAIVPLEHMLRHDGPEATVAAAYALAALGAPGAQILEREVLESRTLSACAALEALERARSERVHLVPA